MCVCRFSCVSVSSSSALWEVWSPKCNQNHWKWKETQVDIILNPDLLSRLVCHAHPLNLFLKCCQTGRTGHHRGRCCRVSPSSLLRVKAAVPLGYVSITVLPASYWQTICSSLWELLSEHYCHIISCKAVLSVVSSVCLSLFSSHLVSSSLWSHTTTAAPSQSCSSLFLAAGHVRTSIVQLSPIRTVGLCRLLLYVPNISMH